MRLSKLTLSGFKSFADKTEIAFDQPMVAIVGPNGCGKSNVVDAIKWVLGEQSAKSLRGGAMLDVIFNGSSSRKPAGLAEVSLHFENPTDENGNRPLSVETDETVVTRRLYRDGTSEYLINGNKSRLRDIRGLFYDTGIGTNAYSIIEQGKVDAMLVSNPIDRRPIFEEAAGISRFKQQKKEARRKLDRTEQNLLRCRDKLEEVQKRLKSVKNQATKARNYQEYTERLRHLQVSYALAEYHKLRTELSELNDKIEGQEQRRRQAQAQLTSAEDQRSAAEAERQELLQQQRELEQQKVQHESQRDQAAQRRQFAESTLEELNQQIERDRQRQHELAQRAEELEGQLDEQRRAVEDLERRVAESEQHIERIQAEHRDAQHAVNEAQAQLDDEKAGTVNLLRRSTELHNQIHSIDEKKKNLIGHRERLDGRAAELSDQLEELLTDRDRVRDQLQQAEQLIERENQKLREQQSAADELSQSQRQLSEKLAQTKEQRSGLESRRQTLQELEDTQTGMDDAVKAVLARKAADQEAGEEGEFAFVHGLLADMISTDVDHAGLVEAALGPHAQSLIVDRLDEVRQRRELLRSLGGRVSFVALDQVPPCRYDAEPAASELPRVIDHVAFDERIGPLMWKLLGRTLIADDLDQACRLRQQLPSGYRFITRAGELLEADGRIVAGPADDSSGAGIISRRSELTELERRIGELDETIQADQAELERISDRAAHIESVQQQLREAVQEANTDKVELSSKLQQHEDAIQRIENEQPVVAREVEQVHEQVRDADRQRIHREREAARVEREQEEARQRTQQLEQKIAELKQQAEQAGERLTEARVEASQASEQLTSAQKQQRQTELARDETRRQAEQLDQQIDQHRRRIEELDQQRSEADQQHAQAENAINEIVEKLDGFSEKLAQIDATVQRLNESVNEHRRQVEQIESAQHSDQVTHRELEVRCDNVRQRVAEQLSLDLDEAYAEYEPEQIDWDQVADEIADLKKKISNLGNVNLDAIDEQSDLERREKDLSDQLEDIETARGELQQLIDQLDEQSRTRFQETFEQIREHFAGADGLFRKLFGGGRADLVLTEDEDGQTDWLESGIDIIAKPPGKEPQSIRLLSGGERTMVAVALLMSIFRSRPSPFCVLDEVDAALDETNVDRFTHVVRSFLDSSHFICITHHKRTMQAADLLYGVTMPTRGVSKKVSVRFDQVSQGGRLSEDAVEQARTEEQRATETESAAPSAPGGNGDGPEKAEDAPGASGDGGSDERGDNGRRLAQLAAQRDPVEVSGE